MYFFFFIAKWLLKAWSKLLQVMKQILHVYKIWEPAAVHFTADEGQTKVNDNVNYVHFLIYGKGPFIGLQSYA